MKKSNALISVLENARNIQKDYPLCDSCLGRFFVKRLSLSSNRLLGQKLHEKLLVKKSKKCFICKDLTDNLDSIHKEIIEKTKNFQFNSFLVGSILKPSIIERDDLLRSKFKLKGIDSVKTDVSRQLAKKFAKKTKAKIDHLKPDLTITVNFKNNSIDLYSKSIILSGRYTKSSRNLPQKQKSCSECKGKGCITCQYHGISGFDSVEGKISEFLYKKFVSNQVRLTWIGGEDKTSLVKGKGRPFFVQVINPQKRKPRLPKIIKLDSVKVLNLKKISAIPKNPIKFRSKIELTVESDDDISSTSLKKINDLKNSDIAIYEESKRIEKSIYGVKYLRITPNSFKLFIEMDGGVPIKKFVDGETIFPNLSDLLETKCICKEFDFTQIKIQ